MPTNGLTINGVAGVVIMYDVSSLDLDDQAVWFSWCQTYSETTDPAEFFLLLDAPTENTDIIKFHSSRRYLRAVEELSIATASFPAIAGTTAQEGSDCGC
jgi:hypothetical protein